MKDDWSGWAKFRHGQVWHQVIECSGGRVWFPCLARMAYSGTEIMDYRWTPPRRCKHVSCQKPGD